MQALGWTNAWTCSEGQQTNAGSWDCCCLRAFGDTDAAAKDLGSAALALAVLAAFCRLPELAQLGEAVESIPLFVKVINAGGVSPIICHGQQLTRDSGQDAADVAAMQDALECLAAAAGASTEGHAVALQSGALPAACHALQAMGSSAVPGSDAAAVQLEALHALLLLLPAPLPQGAELNARLAESARKDPGGWPAAARTGLALLLRARVAAEQRQSALQAAAALANIAGPAWLLGPAEGRAAGALFQPLVEHVKVETMLALRDALNPNARPAGKRAARVLPVTFALAEACLEALAGDTAAAEALADGHSAPGAPLSLLSQGVAQRALMSLAEAAEAVLQFLEALREQPARWSDPLLLAAVRVLGRYLVEVPDAFAERVQRALPFLLALAGGEGDAFLLPALLRATDAPGAAAPDEAAEHAAWLAALRQPQVLEALAAHAARAAYAACKALTARGRSGCDNADDATSAEGALLDALTLLLRALASEGSGEGLSADPESAGPGAAAAAAGALPAVVRWAHTRMLPGQRMHSQAAACEGHAVLDFRLLETAGLFAALGQAVLALAAHKRAHLAAAAAGGGGGGVGGGRVPGHEGVSEVLQGMGLGALRLGPDEGPDDDLAAHVGALWRQALSAAARLARLSPPFARRVAAELWVCAALAGFVKYA
ncbi:hypothetical protein WJX81_007879 [Elliptochloris bilobata]|uniref:Neurochondrin n=1 Tax=Elliptochloris bilobata TaxID=381761 RepID=A0AAW1SET5_9CHLO